MLHYLSYFVLIRLSLLMCGSADHLLLSVACVCVCVRAYVSGLNSIAYSTFHMRSNYTFGRTAQQVVGQCNTIHSTKSITVN